jgi:hypothetical protein
MSHAPQIALSPLSSPGTVHQNPRGMKSILLAASLLALAAPLTGCKRSLDTHDVRQFVDQADEAARKRFAPEICELRGEDFVLKLKYQAIDSNAEPTESEISRTLYCREAGKFSRLRQYRLERTDLSVTVAPDRKTATAIASYVETRPYYEPDYMPVTPDDFRDFVVVESRAESVVGIEGGDLKFLKAEVHARETELLPKRDVEIPYQ